MKTELPCAVVRDLLPSYVEGLTEEETSAAVKSHLEGCERCRRRFEDMSGGDAAPEEETKEVDFLKTVRRKNRRRVLLSVLLAIALVLGGVGAKLFLIGSPTGSESTVVEVTPFPELNSVSLSFLNIDSASVLTDIEMRTLDDVIEITARKVLVSPIHPPEEASVSVNLAGINEVRAFGRTVWQNGIVIAGHTGRLFDRRTDYVGDAPAVDGIISNMDLDAPHTLELQTAREPYGVTIHFTDTIAENRRFMVEGNACLLLALVGNLGEVHWDDPGGYSDSLTLEEADAALPRLTEDYNRNHGTAFEALQSVKDYASDSCQLEVLRRILGV